MRLYKCVTRFTAILLLAVFIIPLSVFAADVNSSGEKRLGIATVNNGPLSIDRLLYTALKDIHYYADISNTLSLQQSYNLANSGERDGVVSFHPNMLEAYPNLARVPVVIENNGVKVFARADGDYNINGWEDISGLKAGILTERIYLAEKTQNCSSVTERENYGLLFDGLAAGEYDIVVLAQREHEIIALPEGVVLVSDIETLPDYLYLNKRLEDIVPAVTDAINNVFADGRGDKILDDVRAYDPGKKKTILHIISTNMDVAREEQFLAALKKPFEDDMSLEWYTVELHSRRFARDSNRLVFFAGLLRQDCVSRDVAAIVVSGDEALGFVKDLYYLYFKNIPVLYYGVNEERETAAAGYEQYFTGIEEDIAVAETVSAAIELFPDAKNLFVINDHSTEGNYYKKAAERQLQQFSERLNIEYNDDTDYDTLIGRIKELPENTILFVGSYFCDSNGQYYTLNEMERNFEKDCEAPVFAVYSTGAEYNSVGGKCLDYEKYAEIISGMLERVLNGESVKDIPSVSDSSSYSRWVFNKTVMDKTGVKESELPEGSEILNKKPPIWESDPRFAFTVLAALIVCVGAAAGGTYLLSKNRKQKELIVKDETIMKVKEHLERVINTAPVAFMSSIDCVVVESNNYIQKYVGIEPGDSPLKFYANPDQRDELLARLSQEGAVRNEIVNCVTLEGEIHRFLCNINNVEYEGRQGLMLWGVDIEERESQKDQIYGIQQSLQQVLDMLPVGVRVINTEDSRISYANKAAMELFGCETPEEIMGRSVYDFLPEVQPNGMKTAEIIRDMTMSGSRYSTEVQYYKLNGEPFDARITSFVIDYKQEKACLAMIEDLTAEKERRRLLLEASEKEKEANQLKSRFLVNMSHEIRTPMNAVIGLTEIELRKDPPKETKEIYKKINTSAKNLLEIVNDILDLSKIEADKIELYEDEFELEDVFNSAMLVATPRLDGKNVEFMLDASPDLPQYVIGDRTRLWQILKNFLDNSAKYTEKGKIVLSCSVDAEASGEETVALRFGIRDTGIGMTEDQMKKLFMPYEQVKNDAQKRYSGTGLGMAISKQLCELMGGSVRVDSRVGEGTFVAINLPFKRSGRQDTALDLIKAPALAGLRVLAVDDDQLSLDIMTRLLEINKIKYATAKNGKEALELVLRRREMGETFDLILLDYMMDGLNGLETAKQITMALSKAPRLLMVTAYQKLILMSELEKNGISDLIEKPFIPSQFIHKLCAVMGYEGTGESEREEFQRYEGVNILLCEDYALNQEVAAGMLAQFGLVADMADNGRAGVEMLMNGGKQYDLIFMDIQMPVMDGYEATETIRADHRFDNIPIISLTADAMKEIVDKCIGIGMNDHISKPLEFSSLQRVFEKWLPESKRAGTSSVVPAAAQDPGNEALARFGGNKALYEKALAEFARMFPEKWDDFERAMETAEETGKFVHKLKGAAGNLAEKEIYGYSVGFESSLRGGSPDRELYEKLIESCEKAKARILSREKDGVVSGSAGGGVPEELAGLLIRLKDALENYNPVTSSDIINILQGKSWSETDEKKLKGIYEHTMKYEFDDALESLAASFDLGG